MGFPENVLTPREKVLVTLHPHWRVVAGPTIIGLILIAGAIYVSWLTPDDTTGNRIQWVVVALGLLIGIWLVVVPFVQRASTQYVITSHRVMVRKGVFTKTGKDIALSKITDVSFTKTPSDRMLGSGTLRIESAGDSPDETFHSIPHSDRMQQLLNHAIDADANKRAERLMHREDGEAAEGPTGESPDKREVGEKPRPTTEPGTRLVREETSATSSDPIQPEEGARAAESEGESEQTERPGTRR